MVLLKHDYMNKIHEENKSSEINMLKVKQMMNSLNKPVNQDLSNVKCEIYGARRNK